MTPIEKNIIVVDENGKQYESTYLKRAKGLVKNGRAHFAEENKICLMRPPENYLEDKDMAEINKEKNNTKMSLEFILNQIEKVQSQLLDLKNTVNNIGCVADCDYNGE